MSDLYEKTIHKLELDRVLEMLSECAGSAEGKNACLHLHPDPDMDTVQDMLNETTAACELSVKKGMPGFSGVSDVAASLDRASRGGCLQPKELLNIGSVLRCARSVKSFISKDDPQTVLTPYFDAVVPNKYLEDQILGAILSEEEIADSASSELSDIRRHKRIQSGKIRDSLQKIISSPTYSKILQEPIITLRQGRYVVPVKSECKNDLPGMVHDVSSTGSTYFIEPMSAVNANNALRELEIQEQKEIERILCALSADCAAHREDILQTQDALIRLDVIFAKARLSQRMNGGAPEMNDRGEIRLLNARHPLIDPKKVVPISLRLGTDFDTMVITGPNTGGKTVTLKTVGLLTLMAQCGLHIPAGSGSTLSVYESILADIGDEQSITQSLSTFSGHMRTIVDIIGTCGNKTLVLFDELGAGTDPAEGAALAIALIEYCRDMGCGVLATTHYAELKLYAMRTDGVINASCEFDVETLRPTYKLLIGIPGKSNAFAISEKLGLPDHIIKKATDLVGQNDKDFQDVLSQLELQRQQMESTREETERLRRETEDIKRRSEKFQEQLEQERNIALENARAEANRIIEDARSVAYAATDEIKAIKKQLSENGDTEGINRRQAELRRRLNEAQSGLHEHHADEKRSRPTREIRVGDTVELLKFGTKASVTAVHDDGSLELQAGAMKLTVKADEVYLTEVQKKEKKGHPAHSGREMKTSAMSSEIDLRGMDSIEAICVLDRYLDEAMRANLPSVRIIHGKGTGTLREAVKQSLRRNRFIKTFRLGVYGEGEDGVTIVEFR